MLGEELRQLVQTFNTLKEEAFRHYLCNMYQRIASNARREAKLGRHEAWGGTLERAQFTYTYKGENYTFSSEAE